MTGEMATYLEAKRSVDDRALNRRVLERFVAELSSRRGPVRILELGAGVGTMIARFAAWDLFPDRVTYRAVDRDSDCIAHARDRLPTWLERAGYDVEVERSRGQSTTVVARPTTGGEGRLEIVLETADALEIDDAADVVVASAVLDLVDLEAALPAIAGLLVDDGVLYAPITFDGETGFAPRHPLDDSVERLYHRHMDEIRDGGTSRAGRALLGRLSQFEWDVLASGGSDWIVSPRTDGERGATYPGDEAVVLAHVLETIEDALAAVPATLEPAERRRWIDERNRQLEAGELVYVAHNLDVLARVPGG